LIPSFEICWILTPNINPIPEHIAGTEVASKREIVREPTRVIIIGTV